MPRLSLLHLLLLVAVAGISIAALRSGHELWAQLVFLLTAAALIVSALAALAWDGDERRWFAVGFALVGSLCFWSVHSKGSRAINEFPYLKTVADYFYELHDQRVSLLLDDGSRAARSESGNIIIRRPNGSLLGMREESAEKQGYPVAQLRTRYNASRFREIAEHILTLALAYLGGLAGLLVRRSRRADGAAPS